MLRQLKYFQSVVRNKSFSEAAAECHISQSAISQQMQALERSLGFSLFTRRSRRFELTPAGEHFYKKSLILLADYEQLCRESAKIAGGRETALTIGFLRGYAGTELNAAMAAFSAQYPNVSVQIRQGNHEELFELLRTERADLVLSDQRRAFSDEYVNLILSQKNICAQISRLSPLAGLDRICPQELKNLPCILIASASQQSAEREYYRDVLGFQGDYLFTETLEQARLLVISGKGFLPAEQSGCISDCSKTIAEIPLYRGKQHIKQTCCAFWKADNSGYYIETFAGLLQEQFEAK